LERFVGTVFFASYLIGLRDGLEAALVISILVAFLNRSSRRDRLREVWAGVAAAVVVSAAVGVLLTTVAGWLGSGTRMELFEAVTSLVAVALVTWMIFWMRRTARTLKGELTGRLETALSMGGWAVVTMAFFAVLREGVEMVLLVFAAAEGATDSAAPLLGMVAGIASAVGLGWVITTATVRINLGRFFTWTGALLILVAAGILKYGVHGLQSAGVLPGGNRDAFDLSTTIDPTSWYATLLAGTVNLTPRASVLEITAWLAFAGIMLGLFFRPARTPRPAAQVRANAFVAAGTVVALGLAPGGCGGGSAPAAPADEAISITATDTGCELSTDHTASGQRTFAVGNKGTKITEFYVYGTGDRIVGQVENVAPGVRRDLHVELAPGSYTVACKPGMVGAGVRGPLTVTGPAAPQATDDAAHTAAAAGYRRYVLSRADAFVEQTGGFVAAVKAGDRALAEARYPVARTYYERIETVAATFGDLDPGIDARDGDLDPGAEWTGYHRIEQQLWGGGDPAAVAPVADRLLANVDGSRAAIAALRPILDVRRPDLGPRLDARFSAVDAELAKYRQGDGYVAYTTLQPNQVQLLSGTVNALGKQVSAVPAAIANR
jgi:high-affinity iron transporter